MGTQLWSTLWTTALAEPEQRTRLGQGQAAEPRNTVIFKNKPRNNLTNEIPQD